MILFNRIAFVDGIDIHIFGRWIGLHYYWQSIPLFDIINSHRKSNTVHCYGIIIFGLWLYLKVDH